MTAINRRLSTIKNLSGFSVVSTSYESIATVTVGSGGSSTITFSSIPSTYKHLQLRISSQTNRGTFGTDFGVVRFNSDSGSNYVRHFIGSDGASALVGATTSTTFATAATSGTSTGGTFGANVIDILDYADTNKYKTLKNLSGNDLNGAVGGYYGELYFLSGLWMSTSAISTITITPNSGTLFTQHSTFALYGIKGAA